MKQTWSATVNKVGLATTILGVMLFLLPYCGRLGWRSGFMINSLFRYPDRALDPYFWNASWGMSGDLIYGSIEGNYDAFGSEGVSRLVLFIGVLGLATTRGKSNPIVLAISGAVFLWANSQSFLYFQIDELFWVSQLSGYVALRQTSSLLRNQKVAMPDSP